MKAAIQLTEEDLKATFMERWAPRNSTYLRDGPEEGPKMKIVEMRVDEKGATIMFSDEPG